jgi:hypothetical protein
MKKIINIFILFVGISAFSQSPIYPIYGVMHYSFEQNAYYKDIDNIHDQHEGTWLYTNGNTSLKITFVKKTMKYYQGNFSGYYCDFLVGEYQYIENGVEKINTLSNLLIDHFDALDYNLCSAGLKPKKSYPRCVECLPEEKRLRFHFNEPSRRHLDGLYPNFSVRVFTEDNVQKMKIWFVTMSNGIVVDKNTQELSSISKFTIPYGEYVLVKQP